MEEIISTIEAYSDGATHLEDEIIRAIKENHMWPQISKYINRNVYIDNEEVESVFLIGCLKALREVDVEIGNPLRYILWKGRMEVAQLFRKNIKSNVRLFCFSCEKDYAIGYKRRRVCCPSCNTEDDIETYHVFEEISRCLVTKNKDPEGTQMDGVDTRYNTTKLGFDDVTTVFDDYEKEFSISTHHIQIDEMRNRLSGRKLQLFNILVVEELNRDSSNNYLQEIADRWGVTTGCVAVHLSGLREEISEYYGS